jgi:3-hydroxyacyl-[acyl-carrier-protein] dehydratase
MAIPEKITREPLIDPAKFAEIEPIGNVEEIRKYNEQRYEMEQLTGVLFLDYDNGLTVTYKDVTDDEFWVRGHIPGRPLMPGVIMLEAAAQTCSYYYGRSVEDPRFMGFMGLEQVRFRGIVSVGDRLIVAAKCLELKSRRMVFDCQGFVGPKMMFQCRVLGTPV